jgi:hypothetical protein
MRCKRFVEVAVFFSILFFITPVLAQDPYLIGVTMAVTGPGSETYGPIKDALDIYFEGQCEGE